MTTIRTTFLSARNTERKRGGTIITLSPSARAPSLPEAAWRVLGNSATVFYGGWADWTNISDGRFKTNIKANVSGLAFINQLRPVTYHLKATALDQFLHSNSKQTSQAVYTKSLAAKRSHCLYRPGGAGSGSRCKKESVLISQVWMPLKNASDTYGLRYDEFVVPLIKAVQELSKENDELQKQIDELKALIKK